MTEMMPDEIALLGMDELEAALAPDHDVEELCVGIELILEYLNDSNEFEKLELIQRRAVVWCLEYFGPSKDLNQSVAPVLEEHPRLFDMSIPSLLRLDPGLAIQPEVEVEEPETVPFPTWSEPMLLSDAYLFRILELYDEEHEDSESSVEDATAAGGTFDYKINAKGLEGSPILYHLPAVLSHISKLDLSEFECCDNGSGTVTRTNSTISTIPDSNAAQPPTPPTGLAALASRALDMAFPGRSRPDSEKKPGLTWSNLMALGRLTRDPGSWKQSDEDRGTALSDEDEDEDKEEETEETTEEDDDEEEETDFAMEMDGE